jgi:ubiquinone/menaquinone biosynthesis C-methylase UbiE
VVVAEHDAAADRYDETRGGEGRGDEYAAELDARLPAGEGPVLEIGVGTGVVALGLLRRGRKVIGVDLSAPMLGRAQTRLGSILARSDATQMGIATASVAHAVSVWVVHSIADPTALFREAARVIRPGGLYLVCTTQRSAPEDPIGRIIDFMGGEVDARREARRPRTLTGAQVLDWAADAGFTGHSVEIERRWMSSPAHELAAITARAWPALHDLDEQSFEEVTGPAVEALQSLPDRPDMRRALVDMITLQRH